jgi:hypothetical protein
MLLLLACRPAPDVEVVDVRDLGTLEQDDGIRARDGGYSVGHGGRSLWLYGDSILSLAGEDGSSWRDNTASWTEDLDAADGIAGFAQDEDALGAPREFFPPTEAEAAFDAAHTGEDCAEEPCGARYALWPGAAVSDGTRVLAFYGKIYGEPGEWSFYEIGEGIAVWDGEDVTRPELRPGTDEPTLGWLAEDGPTPGEGAAIDGDTLYAYSCEEGAAWSKPCKVACAPLDDALDPDAWRWWDGEAWVADAGDAAALFDGSSQMTVHRNEALGLWLAVYDSFDTIRLRTAERPEGPWSEEVDVAQAEVSWDGGFTYCGLAHPEYTRDTTELVTYYRSPADWEGEIRVLEVELGGR